MALSSDGAGQDRGHLQSQGLLRADTLAQVIVQTVRTPLLVLDEDTRVLRVNPAFSDLLGTSADRAMGRSLFEIQDGLWNIPDLRVTLEQVVSGRGQPRSLEVTVRLPGGEQREISFDARHVRLEDHEVALVLLSAEDVTERSRYEERIRFQAELLDAVGQAIMATDLAGKILYWNRAAERTYGWSEEDVLGRNVLDVTPSATTRAQAGEIMEAMRRGEPWSGELELQRKSGEVFPALVANSPILDEDGRHVGIIGVTSDISDLKEVEAAFHERVKELRTLYAVTRILNAPDAALDERLQRFVEALPPGWLYPDVTEARLTLGDVTVSTPGFRPTPWHMASEVRKDGTILGQLEVVLTEERPPRAHGPFLEEECDLLKRLAADVAEAVDRDRLIRELEASEKRFRQIAEHIEHVFWLLSPDDGTVEYVSPAYRRIWGRDPEELYAHPATWLESVHPDDRARAKEAALRLERDVEYRIVRPDGSIRWIQDRASPVRNEAGEVECVVGVSEDVTERKKTGERLDLISREMSDAMLVVGEDATVRFATPSISKILGYSSSELEGTDGLAFIHPDDRGEIMGRLRALIQDRSTRQRSEYRVVTKAGETRHAESIGTNLTDRPGIEGVLITMRDITERVELEERVLRSQRLEAVGRLGGGIAHDFNNLLTVIRSQTDLVLMDTEHDDPLRPEIEAIQSAAGKAARLTSQLLAFSRELLLQPRVVRLCDVIERMGGLLERVIEENVVIQMDLAGDLTPVCLDPAQLEQAVLNLAINARDAMPEGGTLHLVTAEQEVDEEAAERFGVDPGTYCILRVSDTGVGMDQETRRQVFEPFFTTKSDGGGSGLGLSMVYGFMRQSGGYVEVESNPGEGTGFTLGFPTVDAEVEQIGDDEKRAAAHRDLTGRLLVVEDDDSVRRAVVKILERAGLEVVEARAVDEARQCLEQRDDIHVVLTDLVLPGASGRSLVDWLREFHPRIPVIIMSGYSADSAGHRGDLPTDIPFIQKPFTPAELLEEIQKAMDEVSAQEAVPFRTDGSLLGR